MTTAQVAHLLGSISTQHVFAFFLVLARITPLFIIAPVFSSTLLLPRVRSVLGVALALGLTPLAEHGQTIPTGVYPLAGLLLENALVGFGLAFTLACVYAAIQGAGVFADAFGGFSFGSMIDPVNGNPGGAMTNLYTIIGLAIFLVIGGDAWMLRGLAATFNAVPIADTVQVKPLLNEAEAAFESVLVGSIEIAAPVMLAIMVTDIAFGMLSKVVPQISVFSIGFTLKVGVTLLVVAVSLPFMANWLTSELNSSVATAIHSLKIG